MWISLYVYWLVEQVQSHHYYLWLFQLNLQPVVHHLESYQHLCQCLYQEFILWTLACSTCHFPLFLWYCCPCDIIWMRGSLVDAYNLGWFPFTIFCRHNHWVSLSQTFQQFSTSIIINYNFCLLRCFWSSSCTVLRSVQGWRKHFDFGQAKCNLKLATMISKKLTCKACWILGGLWGHAPKFKITCS